MTTALAKRPRTEDPKPVYKDEGITFAEDFKREPEMIFAADSIKPWVNEIATLLFPELLSAQDQTIKFSAGLDSMELRMKQYDPWVYEESNFGSRFGLAFGTPRWRRNWQHCGKNQSWTTDRPVKIPTLVGHRYGAREVWMSLTPMEISTLRACHSRCKGKVVMGGLGLGYSALRVLQRTQVTHVTIVETFQPLIDLIKPHLKWTFGDRVSFVKGSIWNHLKVTNTGADLKDYDTAFIDVWTSYGGNKEDRRFQSIAAEAKRLSRSAVAWG